MGIPTHTDTLVWRGTLRQVLGQKPFRCNREGHGKEKKRGKEDTPDWRDPLRRFFGPFRCYVKGHG